MLAAGYEPKIQAIERPLAVLVIVTWLLTKHVCLNEIIYIFMSAIFIYWGTAVAQWLRCYKSEGCWFDPSWCHWNFSLT